MDALRDKTALVLGAGSLGGPALLALAAAGVGRVLLAEGALVEPSDLAGQPLLLEAEPGQPRGAAAARRLATLAPGLAVEVDTRPIDAATAAEWVGVADLVLDTSNHFTTMFLANDAAMAAGRPLLHAGLLQFTLHLLTVIPGTSGCLRCLFEGPPAPAPPAGLLGPLAGLGGALLAAEAVRLLEGRPGAYVGRLLVHDARSGRSRAVPVGPRPGCAACGPRQPARPAEARPPA
jgi:molybdopterin/thiamine biosynthesis adenylyltransferase